MTRRAGGDRPESSATGGASPYPATGGNSAQPTQVVTGRDDVAPKQETQPVTQQSSGHRRRRRGKEEDDDIIVEVAPSPPMIPEGEYTARSARVTKTDTFGRTVLRLDLELFGGEYDGTTLFWFAGLPKEGKRPRKAPKGYSSKFGRAWELAAGRRAERGERLSAKMLLGKLFRVRVITVTRNYEQRTLPEVSRYSVVRDLLGRDEGGRSGGAS